jgi:MFS family permease
MRSFFPVHVANIFLSLHYAAILYINSTFLEGFLNSRLVSVAYLLAALLNIFLFLIAPRLIEKLGVHKLYLIFIIITGSALLSLANAHSATAAMIFFIIYAGFQFMIYYCLDIFLEDLSVNRKTGGIRGLYLTLGSAAIASAPLLLAFFAKDDHLKPIYIAATLLLIPPFLFGLAPFKKETRRTSTRSKLVYSLPFRVWWRAASVRHATLARLVLEIFYALMVIYTPLYLHTIVGFEWRELGFMFTIMLLPFVIFEWPVGVIADRWIGEKEIMSAGFFITGIMLLIMPFIGFTFLLWTVALFMSRVGASFIEVTTESHFFKHVDSRDASLISIFRLTRPIGLILGSVIGILTFSLFSFEKIFFVIAIVLLFGLRESLYLKDTL